MHSLTEYERRETLSAHELEWLRAALVDEEECDREAIGGYSSEKMAKHGQPFLKTMENRVTEVERSMSSRRS